MNSKPIQKPNHVHTQRGRGFQREKLSETERKYQKSVLERERGEREQRGCRET
jgi:hypothetical protein